MLDFLGKFGKGYGTLVGVGVAVGSVLGGADVAETIQVVGGSVWNIGLGVGSILAAFGVGRKAGAALRK